MALSVTATANYFIQGKQGKTINVLNCKEVNQDVVNLTNIGVEAKSVTTESKDLNSQHSRFVKMTKVNDVQRNEELLFSSEMKHCGTESPSCEKQQMKLQTIKFEPSCNVSTMNIKCEVKNQKYTNNHKFKAHAANQFVQRKRKPEKAGKGLRHFSMKVCEKVKEKGSTTYNEVADELVAEEIQNQSYDTANCDQKNIRRRVYDALNVLMAMNIISKDKKEIRWIGLPTNSIEQYVALEKENEKRRERIEAKHQQLRELILQQVSFKSLVERNIDSERKGIIPPSNSSIQLPFIIVNTHKSTKINCSVTNDKSEYIFKFDDKFEMHDDAEVLKRMGLLLGLEKGKCSCDDIERAKMLVPPNFGKYIEAYGRGEGLDIDSEEDISYIDQSNYSSLILRTEGGDLTEADDDAFLKETEMD